MILKHSINRISFCPKSESNDITRAYIQTYGHHTLWHIYVRPPKNIKWANKFKLLKLIMRQNMASHMYPSHATSTVELSTSYQSYVSFWRFTRKKALIRHEPDKTFISPTFTLILSTQWTGYTTLLLTNRIKPYQL